MTVKSPRQIRLPITLKEFDDLISIVVHKYKLEDAHHAAAIISNAIRHLPNSTCYTTLDYLGQTVLKNIANHVADHKSKMLQHSAQIEHLFHTLTSDPSDTQARDKLITAANDGSEEAKKALKRLETESIPQANA